MVNYRRGKQVIREKPRRGLSASSSSSYNNNNGVIVAVNSMNNTLQSFNLLPPGFRFCPTDSELVNNYLAKQVHNQELPPNNIFTLNIYQFHPTQLEKLIVQSGGTELYCFTPRDRKYKGGDRPKRQAVGGYWKASGAATKVVFAGKVIGSKRSLVFHDGNSKSSVKSDWLMHEYELASNAPHVPAKYRYPDTMKLDDCVLCKIYEKKKEKKGKQSVEVHETEAAAAADDDDNEVQVDVQADDVKYETTHEMEKLAAEMLNDDDCVDPGLIFADHHDYQLQQHPSSINNMSILPPPDTMITSLLQPLPLDQMYSYSVPSSGFVGFCQPDFWMNISSLRSAFGGHDPSAYYKFESDKGTDQSMMIANIPDELSAAFKNHVNPMMRGAAKDEEASTSNPVVYANKVNLENKISPDHHLAQEEYYDINNDPSTQPMKRTRRGWINGR